MYSKIIDQAPSEARRQARVTCYFGIIHTNHTESVYEDEDYDEK